MKCVNLNDDMLTRSTRLGHKDCHVGLNRLQYVGYGISRPYHLFSLETATTSCIVKHITALLTGNRVQMKIHSSVIH